MKMLPRGIFTKFKVQKYPKILIFKHMCCVFLIRNWIVTWRAKLFATKICAVASPLQTLPQGLVFTFDF